MTPNQLMRNDTAKHYKSIHTLFVKGRSEPENIDKQPYDIDKVFNAWMVIGSIILAILLMITCCQAPAHAEMISGYDVQTWATAIRHAEGNPNYGILAHYKHTSYRQACINTIRHTARKWALNGRKVPFLVFLGRIYAPINSNTDNGTNKYWIRNVSYWIKRV